MLSFHVVLFFMLGLVKELLLLGAIRDLIDELLLGLGIGEDLFVVQVEPANIIMLLFK